MFETGTGLSSSESVLTGGVEIWLGDLVLPCKDPLRFFLDLGRIESEDRLQELSEVTNPCPFGLADPSMSGWLSHRQDEGEVRFDASEDAAFSRSCSGTRADSIASWMATWRASCEAVSLGPVVGARYITLGLRS